MSIFNFLKDVGKKIMDRNQSHSPQESGPLLAQKLEEHINNLQLGIKNPKIKMDGDKAILEGTADSPESIEKAILAIGNTAGIAQVDMRIQSQQKIEPKFYTVKKGDNLSKIAKETLGNANRYNEIFKANQPLIKDPDEIYPGQQLRIPQDNKAAA